MARQLITACAYALTKYTSNVSNLLVSIIFTYLSGLLISRYNFVTKLLYD